MLFIRNRTNRHQVGSSNETAGRNGAHAGRTHLAFECLEDRTLLDSALANLMTTASQDDFISGLYSTLLHRSATSQEMANLTQSLSSGLSRSDATVGILSGTEYVKHHPAWLTSLYTNVLGRSPDARSQSAWRTALHDGVTRHEVALGFVDGKEFQALITTATAGAEDAPDFVAQNLLPPLLVHVKTGIANGLSRLMRLGASLDATAEPTSIPRLYRVNGDNAALTALTDSLPHRGFVQYVESEATLSVDLVPNDPSFTDNTLYGLNGANGIDAPSAWNTTTGSTRVTVGVIDTGVDYDHPDLYKNIWLNQAEIPNSWLTKKSSTSGYNRTVFKSNVQDVDGDGRITFWDLNAPANTGLVWDNNGDGRIDADDILRSRVRGGWETGADDDYDGYTDDLVGWNFVSNNNKPFDDNEHGTHVSGTIGGIGNNGTGVAGVNWAVQIMPLKFLSGDGRGSNASAAAAIRFAANHGVKVTNNSWGGGSNDSTLRDAIQYAGSKGEILVVAAGNDGKNISITPSYPAAYHLPNMIVVAATDSNGNLANFSNTSATLVDVAAPGVNIYSTVPNGGYAFLSGTSMATPHVTGVVALVLAAQPSLTTTQVIGRVVNNTTPLASLAGKTVTGGLVDAAQAVGSNSNTPGAPDTPGPPSWFAISSSTGYLSWSPVSGATSYKVQYSSNGSTWQNYGSVGSATLFATAGYYYRVAAVNSSGISAYTSAVFAGGITGQPPSAPGAPTWSSDGGDTITLSWNAVGGATSYEVQWWNSSIINWVTLGTYTGTSASITHGLGFYWQVRALNSYGSSNYSPYILAGGAPNQPSWYSAGGSDIYLNWNNVGASSYVVDYWNSSTGSWVNLGSYSAGTTSIKILFGYSYYWRVGAIYSISDPVYSAYVHAL